MILYCFGNHLIASLASSLARTKRCKHKHQITEFIAADSSSSSPQLLLETETAELQRLLVTVESVEAQERSPVKEDSELLSSSLTMAEMLALFSDLGGHSCSFGEATSFATMGDGIATAGHAAHRRGTAGLDSSCLSAFCRRAITPIQEMAYKDEGDRAKDHNSRSSYATLLTLPDKDPECIAQQQLYESRSGGCFRIAWPFDALDVDESPVSFSLGSVTRGQAQAQCQSEERAQKFHQMLAVWWPHLCKS